VDYDQTGPGPAGQQDGPARPGERTVPTAAAAAAAVHLLTYAYENCRLVGDRE